MRQYKNSKHKFCENQYHRLIPNAFSKMKGSVLRSCARAFQPRPGIIQKQKKNHTIFFCFFWTFFRLKLYLLSYSTGWKKIRVGFYVFLDRCRLSLKRKRMTIFAFNVTVGMAHRARGSQKLLIGTYRPIKLAGVQCFSMSVFGLLVQFWLWTEQSFHGFDVFFLHLV